MALNEDFGKVPAEAPEHAPPELSSRFDVLGWVMDRIEAEDLGDAALTDPLDHWEDVTP